MSDLTVIVEVSGQHVLVFHQGVQVYQFEPDGESWAPGWYDSGQLAVLDAAAKNPNNMVLEYARLMITELRKRG